jgi:pimeloyl-ACP methyl ester carboxylesterase
MITEEEVQTNDGRVLRVYDTHPGQDARMVVFWHHGTPNIGAPPGPLLTESDRLGIRWVSYDRPGYGGSTRHPGRDVASAAFDVAKIADLLRIDRFATMGHSG